MSEGEILTMSKLERMLGDDCKLVEAVGPPFCDNLESHFIIGCGRPLGAQTLDSVVLDVLLRRSWGGLKRATVLCDRLKRSYDGSVKSGVVCDPGVLEGFLVREFEVGGSEVSRGFNRFLLGRRSFPREKTFEDWLKKEGVRRSCPAECHYFNMSGRVLLRTLKADFMCD